MRTSAFLTILFGAGLLAGAGPQDPRLPPPTDAARKEAEKLVRDIFKAEYSNPAGRVALARKLLQQGIETRDEPASRYVLLREASDLAAAGGDLDTALAAIRELAQSFAVDEPAMRLAALNAVASSAKSPDESKRVADLLLKLSGDAAASEKFDLASQAASAGAAAARKTRDIALVSRADARTREVAEHKAAFDRIKEAREKLAARPEDPEANLALGRYLCLIKGDWEAGLSHLSKCGQAALQAAAKRDLARPAVAGEQAAVGDAWWDLGEKESGAARRSFWGRAASWYEQAAPGLTGLSKVKAEKRLAQVQGEGILTGWVDLTDARRFGLQGAFGEPIVVTPEPGQTRTAFLTEFPKGDFDGFTARMRMGSNQKVHGVLVFERAGRGVYLFPEAGQVYLEHYDKVWIRDVAAECGKRELYTISVSIEGGEYVVTVDGEEKLRIKTAATAITFLALKADLGAVTFEGIRLRRRRSN